MTPPVTPENDWLLRDAETNRQRKAAEWAQHHPPVETLNSVADACARLGEKLKTQPTGSVTLPDPRIAQARALLDAAGLPKRHACRVSAADDAWHITQEKIVARLGNGFLIALTGPQGTGKTQLASAVVYAATDKLLSARYAVAMDFFIALKSTFDDASKSSEQAVIDSFVKPKLLVLDECDERSESPWENRLLFHMLNKRYNALLDTLLISRRSETEFLQSLGESVQSRIQETGGSLHCDWPSFREAK